MIARRPRVKQMLRPLRRLPADSRGATAVEYGVILAVIGMALLVGLRSLAGQTSSIWNNVSTQVEAATPRP